MSLPRSRFLPRARTGAAAILTAGSLVATLAACSGGGSSAGSPASDSSSTAAATTSARVVHVTVTAAKGCTPDHAALRAGALTFKIDNTDAAAVSEVELLSGERIVGEKENLPPGFSGEFVVKIGAGNYQLYCPGGTPERSNIEVTGKSVNNADASLTGLLKDASNGYAAYVNTQVAALVTATGELNKTLHGKSLAAAQRQYMLARPFYEKIEPVAESFLGLDAAIDARANNVPASKWRGFHRIEKGLFEDKSLTGLATFGNDLVTNVGQLKAKTAHLTYQPTELANGAQGLLDEVAANKITGEEERYSHIDLLDFANNDEGAEQAFAQLQPALEKIDPVLTATVAARFAALDKLVNTYRTTSNASGFRLYPTLTAADKRQLAAAVTAVQAPLSVVASKVANA